MTFRPSSKIRTSFSLAMTVIALSAGAIPLASCGPQPASGSIDDTSGTRPIVTAQRSPPSGGTIANPFGASSDATTAAISSQPPAPVTTATDVVAPDMEAAADRLEQTDSTPPAEVREPAPTSYKATGSSSSSSSGSNCTDGKRTCGQMENCEDAMFHLQQCGVSRLDGDHDGTPCEKICG